MVVNVTATPTLRFSILDLKLSWNSVDKIKYRLFLYKDKSMDRRTNISREFPVSWSEVWIKLDNPAPS